MTQMFPPLGDPPQMPPFLYAGLHSVYGWTIRSVQVLAEAGVYDALGDAPEAAAAIAERTGCNADALERMMRLLASVDIFERQADGRYTHSPASRALRRDSPISAGDSARLQAAPLFQSAVANLNVTLRTGGPSIGRIAPDGMWAYLAQNPDEARIFDGAMSNQSSAASRAVVAAYDFKPFKRIGDIGGGQGGTIRAILDAAPNATGVLFDLPDVVAEAPAHDRLDIQGGSFLTDALPTGCDCLILKFILHDWPDDKARDILRAVRKAAAPGTTLLVIEAVRSEAPGFHPSKLMDVSMLALFGGRERTPGEFSALFSEAGFALKRAIPTPIPIASVIEAVAV